ncbi:VPLPA-CTERM sorting domain-containing protein [Octadecabacter sp. 1_MG-2023]|uniref:VPLPA-CTERM sorting domain-containing protein n=1 Tax=unclassified Octadecabacter TaxID=196158 RepID=UPI001C084F9B|nr:MULTISPECIES: VPLPA-CTERM sorting domain-containing protein [unclassified Octadecabacter]MBU2994443.1 VPLPA-CTERM sorting domain-containing protein [Octadecabacter sp. B2R22]MDO6734266.1 VPLPA-CTERM sorting domain-containing protein [Octadecabacter sp. 1_MG-2023]
MKKFIGALALSIAAFGSSFAQAATLIVDDVTFGTSSVLRDTTNNQDFLRLDLTMGYGYSGISSEFGVGGDFEGWSVASTMIMDALGVSAGVINGSTDVGQIGIAESLRDFFCPASTCVNLSSTHEYARGLVSDSTAVAGTVDAFSIGRRFNVDPNEVDFRISGYGGLNAINEEVWLTRTALTPVPLPAAGWLLIAGLAGMGVVGRRKKV